MKVRMQKNTSYQTVIKGNKDDEDCVDKGKDFKEILETTSDIIDVQDSKRDKVANQSKYSNKCLDSKV